MPALYVWVLWGGEVSGSSLPLVCKFPTPQTLLLLVYAFFEIAQPIPSNFHFSILLPCQQFFCISLYSLLFLLALPFSLLSPLYLPLLPLYASPGAGCIGEEPCPLFLSSHWTLCRHRNVPFVILKLVLGSFVNINIYCTFIKVKPKSGYSCNFPYFYQLIQII